MFDHIPNTEKRVKHNAQRSIFDELQGVLDMWWNTVLSVWYIFSIETKTKERNKIIKLYAYKIRYLNTNMVTTGISFVLKRWIINEFEKDNGRGSISLHL